VLAGGGGRPGYFDGTLLGRSLRRRRGTAAERKDDRKHEDD
jgi:hypothetical protein